MPKPSAPVLLMNPRLDLRGVACRSWRCRSHAAGHRQREPGAPFEAHSPRDARAITRLRARASASWYHDPQRVGPAGRREGLRASRVEIAGVLHGESPPAGLLEDATVPLPARPNKRVPLWKRPVRNVRDLALRFDEASPAVVLQCRSPSSRTALIPVSGPYVMTVIRSPTGGRFFGLL